VYHPETQTVYEYLGNQHHPKFAEESTWADQPRAVYADHGATATRGFRVHYLYVSIQHKPFANVLDYVHLVVPDHSRQE
jgi:hypothetical protein